MTASQVWATPVSAPYASPARGDAWGADTTEGWPSSNAPWRDVAWSVTYLAFLWYVAAITTYNVPAAGVAMAAALLGLIVQREPRRFPALLVWLGAFIAWAAIGYPLTRFPEAVQTWVTEMAKVWLIVFVAANALRTRAQIRFFIIFFLACFALYPLRGAFVNYYLASYSVMGRAVWNFIYANPNDLAAFALLQLSMTVGLLVTERKKSWVWLAALAGTVLLTLLVLMTQSRAGIIALGVFVLLLLASRRKHPLVILATGALVVSAAVLAPTGTWARMGGLSKATSTADLRKVDREGSARERFEIWRVAAKIISDQPVLGVGLGAYPLAHASYARDEDVHPSARRELDTHSTVLNVLAETGTPGLLLFLALLITTLWKADRIRRTCRATLPRASTQLLYLEFGLLAFLTAGLFGSFAYLAFLYVHLVLIWATAEACRHDLAQVRRAAAGRRVPRPVWPSDEGRESTTDAIDVR